MSLPVLPRIKPADLSGVPNGRLPGHLLVDIDMGGRTARCHPQLARALRALIHDCRAATKVQLTNVGHYRSFDAQVALLQARYQRAEHGTRFWDGSWWRRMTGAPVATPGRSDHGWGLAVDAAIRDGAGKPAGIYRSPAWSWIRDHLTRYGLCWAWADEGDEPWHWHLFEIGAPAVLAHEAATRRPQPPPEPSRPLPTGGEPAPEFDPARRRYGLYPLNRAKPTLRVGSTGDTVRYLQGVCVNEVSRFAAWFGAQQPNLLPNGSGNPRKLYLQAAADHCARMAIDGHYDESVAQAIAFVQHAFSKSDFGGRRVGVLDADGWVGNKQTWPFIDTLADGHWAA